MDRANFVDKIGFFAARSISRPINQLEAKANKVAGGDLIEQVKIDRQAVTRMNEVSVGAKQAQAAAERF